MVLGLSKGRVIRVRIWGLVFRENLVTDWVLYLEHRIPYVMKLSTHRPNDLAYLPLLSNASGGMTENLLTAKPRNLKNSAQHSSF